jgi:hypothetical protein
MPPYEFDPTKVTATIPIFPKGDYEFVVSEPKSFAKTNEEGKTSMGIRFPVLCEDVAYDADGNPVGDPKFKGKRTIYSGYLHSDGAQAFTKGFLLAALGFDRNEAGERAFDEKYKGQDWGIDPDSGACGDMWRQVTGARVVASLDVAPNKNDPTQMIQQFSGFRRVGT